MTVELTERRIKTLTRTLRADLGAHAPSHQHLLDTIAKGLGFRSYEALKPKLATPADPLPPAMARASTANAVSAHHPLTGQPYALFPWRLPDTTLFDTALRRLQRTPELRAVRFLYGPQADPISSTDPRWALEDLDDRGYDLAFEHTRHTLAGLSDVALSATVRDALANLHRSLGVASDREIQVYFDRLNAYAMALPPAGSPEARTGAHRPVAVLHRPGEHDGAAMATEPETFAALIATIGDD